MTKNTQARIAEVNIDQVTFGVEIECTLSRRAIREHGITIGDYHDGRLLPAPFPSGWSVERDGSIDPDPNYVATEIVSPILTNVHGLTQIAEVIGLLNSLHARVNETCGFHVHVGMPSVLGEKSREFGVVVRWVRRLINLVSKHEPALFAITGRRYRLYSNYCKSIKTRWGGKLNTTDTLDKIINENNRIGRYSTLNLCSLFSVSNTVEFRVFAGTLDPIQAVGNIVTALGLCHRAAVCPTSPKFDTQPATDFVAATNDLQAALCKYGWPSDAQSLYGPAVIQLQKVNAEAFQSQGADVVVIGG